MRGSIITRGKKRHALVLDQGYVTDPATGKRRRKQKWITFRGTKKQAENKLTELVRAFNRNEFVEPTKQTFGERLTTWLVKTGKLEKRPRTHATYAYIAKASLIPALGPILLQQLEPIDLQQYYGERAHLSAATLHLHHAIISAALKSAVRNGLVSRNIAPLVEGRKLVDSKLAEDGSVQFGLTKTGRSRTVDISTDTVALLKAHKRSQAELKMKNRSVCRDHGLVFAKEHPDLFGAHAELGTPMQTHNIGVGEFAHLMKAANVKRITFHGLRHTSATLLLLAGEPVKVVSERLGHAKSSMTLDVYAHVLPSMGRAAADRLGALLHG